MLQHTDSYPTQHHWVITQSFAASDCLIILHSLQDLCVVIKCDEPIALHDRTVLDPTRVPVTGSPPVT